VLTLLLLLLLPPPPPAATPQPVATPPTTPPQSVLEPSESEYESEQDDDSDVPLEKSNKKLYFFGIFIVVLVLGATAGVFYYRTQQQAEEEVQEVVVEEEEEEVAEVKSTPTPAELTREEITLVILNGSGVAGLAGDTADTFKALGYEILSTGNADLQEGNELYVNPEVEGLVDLLIKDADEELSISSVSGELEDSTASAQIILGE